MNSSQTISLLKQIDITLNTLDTSNTSTSNAVNNLTLINGNISSDVDTIRIDTDLIKTDVDTIKTELTKKKMAFNARLTDGSNDYLLKADYSSSPIIFYWQNDKGTPVYITRYRFAYPEGTEPTQNQLYHSTAWESKIGAVDSAGTDFEAPYITVNDNKNYLTYENANAPKSQWVSNITWMFKNEFDEAPIEIGISRKFGHFIQADINTGLYDDNPVGIIDGYYFDS